ARHRFASRRCLWCPSQSRGLSQRPVGRRGGRIEQPHGSSLRSRGVTGAEASLPGCTLQYEQLSHGRNEKGWARRWRENGWRTEADKPTAHADLWDMLLKLCAIHEVEFVWLPASAQIADYEQCDRLARQVLASQIRRIIEDRD